MSDIVTTRINSDILLREPKGGIRFGTDALLLAYFALPLAGKGMCVDLGTGSGAIPLLLLAGGSRAHFIGVEISPEYASAASDNARLNGFSGQLEVFCRDASDTDSYCRRESAGLVLTNPPYMREDCGKKNEKPDMSRARREENGGIASFCIAAGRLLRCGGKFICVYRPDRLCELLCSMRNAGIEPKKLRSVVPSCGKRPSLIIAEGKKGAGEGMIFERDLFIYKDASHRAYSDEMTEIYRRFSGDHTAL